MSIEDPFCLKQSLSRNLMTQTNKYIISVISKSCLYFVQNTQIICKQQTAEENKSYKIVDRLIDETGISDARKAKKELENTSDNESDSDQDEEDKDSSLDSEDDSDNEMVQEFLKDNQNDTTKKPKTSKDQEKIMNNLKDNLNHMLKITNLEGQGASSFETYSSLSTPLDLDQKRCFNFNEESLSEQEPTGKSLDLYELNMDSIKYEKNLNEKFKSILNESNCNDSVKACLDELVDKVVEFYEIVYDSMPNLSLKNLPINEPNLNFNYKFSTNTLNFAKVII